MTEKPRTVCPECDAPDLEKLISSGGAVIIAGREANQYNDIQAAKYWRDKNGVRHRVTSSDGYSTSGTVTQRTATPAEVEARKKADRKADKQKRLDLTTARATAYNKEQAKKSQSMGDGYIKEVL